MAASLGDPFRSRLAAAQEETPGHTIEIRRRGDVDVRARSSFRVLRYEANLFEKRRKKTPPTLSSPAKPSFAIPTPACDSLCELAPKSPDAQCQEAQRQSSQAKEVGP